jgi:5-methylcytosine-specific restriction endonuclease McrA
MKICKCCLIIKEDVAFSKTRRACKNCINTAKRLDYLKDPEKYSLRSAKARKKNRAKILAQKAVYRAKYSEQIKLNKALYRKNNKEKIAVQDKIQRQKNIGKRNAYSMKYHIDKLNKVPKWLTQSDWIEINWVYTLARELTITTGIQHTVDHIIPLHGKSISGLHCPQNLQIVTKSENSKKGNKWPYYKD